MPLDTKGLFTRICTTYKWGRKRRQNQTNQAQGGRKTQLQTQKQEHIVEQGKLQRLMRCTIGYDVEEQNLFYQAGKKKNANENRKEARLGNTFKIKYTTQKGTIEKSFKNQILTRKSPFGSRHQQGSSPPFQRRAEGQLREIMHSSCFPQILKTKKSEASFKISFDQPCGSRL